jgi:bifunctional UDP-N-acetylglucosamine pyrophosphorylase/glucosamine-1-phosphate N-acetyltransferase
LEPQSKLGAIVLAAGRSTRFRSATSKLLHTLAGRPLIQWLLRSLREAQVDRVIVVVAPNGHALAKSCGSDLTFVVQEEQRGTGHAALAAREAVGPGVDELLVVNGDLPLLSPASFVQLVQRHRATAAHLSLMTATLPVADGWGRIVRNDGAVRGIVEERDASPEVRALREVNVGVYCAAPSVLFPLLERVRPDNAQNEIYLTDIVAEAVRDGLRISDVSVPAEEVAQVNSRAELAVMEQAVRQRINLAWMESGVTLEDPATAYVGPDVRIGPDTVIGPNVHLRGQTRVGTGCRFDGSALVTDSVIGDGVHVRFAVVITESEVAGGCQIGPFAQLRPGTRLGPDVHIGNFVETKKAAVGARTKANHLAYLGDVDVGSDANIGAGTITCNYDGLRKHRTVIGDRVQVGSDSQLVAPVTLADDSYVATGTTVRRDVPTGALVFNTRDQVHRPGWVAAFRARQRGASPPDVPVKKGRPARLRAVTESKRARKKTARAGAKKAARPKARRRK